MISISKPHWNHEVLIYAKITDRDDGEARFSTKQQAQNPNETSIKNQKPLMNNFVHTSYWRTDKNIHVKKK